MQNITEIENLIKLISKLPGLGPKSAKRIILKMINNRQELLKPLAQNLSEVYKNVVRCKICGTLKPNTIECSFNNCEIVEKKYNKICVVENISDQWAIESSSIFQGYFHILGGTLSNNNNSNREDLLINSLIERINKDDIEEVILATSATVEGQTTAFYIQDRFGLDLDRTAQTTALLLGTMALAAIVSQLTVVQRYKGSALNLIKFSVPLFVLSVILIIFSPNFNLYYLGMALMGLGMGLASPGYTASASLNADDQSQGAAVGLAMVAPGIGFAVGPFLSGILYSFSMNLPFLFILPIYLILVLLLRKLELLN